ncbi:hypothetical protein [Roseateles depolymerans]|uniref:Uncharacterized protein n=1 Tax=Roseateles depolymerans TaxID=76731 RepID=A0A0U3L7N1_9BURK|nr:hypothetical protein [Roseateles depolymerans]ALV07310.1 hypothetical protein RD2015_2846 [Roseateles depolymerans]REG20294.1 hypothetical protein DES44_2802 [Roseateles depolymerans]
MTTRRTPNQESRLTEPLKQVPKDKPWVFLLALLMLVLNDRLGAVIVAACGGGGAAWVIHRLVHF